MLQNLLKSCGLNETEIKILLFLLNRNETIVSIIAKYTQLKRPTIYASLGSLAQEGLVKKRTKNKISYFSCINPELIPSVLEGKARLQYADIKSATSNIPIYLQDFIKKQGYQTEDIQIEYMESVATVYAELENTIKNGGFCAFFNPQTAIKGIFKDLILKFLKNTSISKPTIKEIIVQGRKAEWYKKQIKNKNHHTKEIPNSSNLISDIILVNGSILINSYEAGSTSYIKIKNPAFYQSLQGIFDTMWSVLP
jgi:sugar-specific transcriptional regulator TrmB